MKKYICFGGYVVSKNDGQMHYIPPEKLPKLYGVPINECILIGIDKQSQDRLQELDTEKYKRLFPKGNGDYTLD